MEMSTDILHFSVFSQIYGGMFLMYRQNAGKRVTLQDIAKRTGYSLTAVSRALRNMSDIGPEATSQIQQVAKEMGYVANQTAVALRYGRTNMITVIVANLTNPYFIIITNLIQLAAQEMGYSLIIVSPRGDPGMEQQLIEQAIARHSDGVLLFSSESSGKSIEMLPSCACAFCAAFQCSPALPDGQRRYR